MLIFYKIWKKYNQIQLTKNKMNFNNQNEKSSALHRYSLLIKIIHRNKDYNYFYLMFIIM